MDNPNYDGLRKYDFVFCRSLPSRYLGSRILGLVPVINLHLLLTKEPNFKISSTTLLKTALNKYTYLSIRNHNIAEITRILHPSLILSSNIFYSDHVLRCPFEYSSWDFWWTLIDKLHLHIQCQYANATSPSD